MAGDWWLYDLIKLARRDACGSLATVAVGGATVAAPSLRASTHALTGQPRRVEPGHRALSLDLRLSA